MPATTVVWFVLATIWGSTWAFIKIGLDEGLPPITFAGIRFLVAAIPLVLWIVVRRVRLPSARGDWWLMLVTGWLSFSINYGLVFWGESHISSGLAAILYTTFPIQGMLLAHAMLPAEPLTVRKVCGTLLAAAGVAVIFYSQVEIRGPMALAGSIALVVAALSTAYADVLIKQRGGHIEPVTMTAVQMVAGFIPLLALGIPLEGSPLAFPWTPRALFALGYLALLGSATTFVLLYWLIQRIEVTRTMLIPLLSTLIAVLLGIVVLGESFSWRTLVGGGAILAGLAVATWRRPSGTARRSYRPGGGAPGGGAADGGGGKGVC